MRDRPARSRPRVLLALAAVVALGLLSRRFPLPGVFAEHTGDALYTVAAFFACALLLPALRPATLATLAFGLSAAVEFAQLLNWPWLQELRGNRWAALVLGQGFQWADLLAYLVGASVAFAVDRALAARMYALGNKSGGVGPAAPSDR